ncbi:hypothetical protein [Mesorhizobium sp. ISC11]|uniref:hypothetical protein n=1 Tax=Mesorhizobium sp. ISC11 TaxID=3076428 RepID=UPI00301D30A9
MTEIITRDLIDRAAWFLTYASGGWPTELLRQRFQLSQDEAVALLRKIKGGDNAS